jgi:hypothetical protein
VIPLLSDILCVLRQIPYFVLWALTEAVNAIVIALAALAQGLAFLLPPFPDAPSMPAELETVMGWVNWVFPVGTVVTILAALAALWLGWQAVAVALRWAKVIG